MVSPCYGRLKRTLAIGTYRACRVAAASSGRRTSPELIEGYGRRGQGLRSIGHIGGELPVWITPISSNPWRA
jgi:hypothetical protein